MKQDYEKKLQTQLKEHSLDMKRVKEKQKVAFDIDFDMKGDKAINVRPV